MKKQLSSSGSLPSDLLFRYLIVSQVLCREQRGEARSLAVDAVCAASQVTPDGRTRRVSRRSLYRWLAVYAEKGFEGLQATPRPKVEESAVLSPELLAFCKTEKTNDPRVSIPELIKRAEQKGLVAPHPQVSRVTLWRSLNRMGVETTGRKVVKHHDQRRFSYPHRMDMVLCDGKHFRAGVTRSRRVALFFLDDATRMVLGVAVGPSESAALFLRGLFEVIKTHGLMSALYVDNGSGFVADDSVDVLRQLGVLFIHGTAGYPEGRGKVERFNRTAQEQLLRGLDANPAIDPQDAALELRLKHYITNRYNLAPHEGLDLQSPGQRFAADARPLRFHDNLEALRRKFILYATRRVSRDNIVTLNRVRYEVLRGYGGATITIGRNLLDHSVWFIHEGRPVRLAPVDLHANARERRTTASLEEETQSRPQPSAAQLDFDREYQPIIDAEGGFSGPDRP